MKANRVPMDTSSPSRPMGNSLATAMATTPVMRVET